MEIAVFILPPAPVTARRCFRVSVPVWERMSWVIRGELLRTRHPVPGTRWLRDALAHLIKEILFYIRREVIEAFRQLKSAYTTSLKTWI
jgi:hypothetical protein